MKLPRNGTAIANALLVLAGVVLGASATWTTVLVTKTPDVSGNGATSTSRLSARGNALNDPRADNPSFNLKAALSSARAERDPRSRRKALRDAGSTAADRNLPQALEASLDLDSERGVVYYLSHYASAIEPLNELVGIFFV